MNDGVPTSLTDHKIGPLNDDDGHEEGRVTRVLEHLPLGVSPLLEKHRTRHVTNKDN